VHAHLRACGLDQTEVGQLGDRLGDRVGVATADLLGPLPERGLICQVGDPARDSPRLAGVGDQRRDAIDKLSQLLATATG
jgi:hypothetical protein